MRKPFTEVEIEILMLCNEDVLTTSAGDGSDSVTTTKPTTGTGTRPTPADTADDLPWDMVG